MAQLSSRYLPSTQFYLKRCDLNSADFENLIWKKEGIHPVNLLVVVKGDMSRAVRKRGEASYKEVAEEEMNDLITHEENVLSKAGIKHRLAK